MDITTSGFIRIVVGLIILAYVGYCLVNRKVWIRGEIGLKSTVFAWGTKEDNQFVFMLHTTIGMILGLYLIVSPFLW